MKIKEFQKFLVKKKADVALIYNIDSMGYNPNLFYFTGYKGIGILVIPKSKRPFLIVPEMEKERAKKTFSSTISSDKKKLLDTLKTNLKRKRIRCEKVVLEKNFVTLNVVKSLKKNLGNFKMLDSSMILLKLRQIKTEKELETLKKAFKIADSIFSLMLKKFKGFKNESQIASFLEYEAKKKGCDVSFPPIVASGKNASIPHYEPQNIRLKKGFCVIDFGIKYKGYCTDMTRTIFIGKPNKKDKEIYNFLLYIQNSIINNLKLNKNCGKIYDDCIKGLKNYKKYFTHGLGHGIGVEIHELPNLTLESKDKIKNNMTFTIEPGIYMPNKLGIRIEDTVLMKNKLITLTKTKKELIILN